ncbi:MAG: hypothetical protein PVI01_15730 [Gemmatimonadales bacterium]|jgi:hypothetical protein
MSSFFPADPGPAARRTALALLVSLFALAEPAAAAWENGYWATVFTPTDSAEKAVCADGQGGTLVAMFDATASLLRVHVSRLAPDGTELWGDGGVAVPFDVYSDEQQDPVDVAPDGTGGAYVAFQEIWGTTHYLTLAHFDNDGSLDWVMPKADFHYQGGALGLRVVAASGGEAILVWPDDPVDTLAPEKLLAMRVDGTGATSWTVAVNQTIDVFDSPSAWDVSSDGMGGVLVAWNAYDSVSTLHAKIQRITAAGSVLWGSDGHDIPGWIGPTRVLPDGAGGGYVVTSLGFGETYGQRIDVNGNARWGSGGILLQDAATYPNPCSFDICVSGGDLHLVQGVTDLYVQRVDLYGNKQWGANGLAITSRAGWQDGASIDSDGQNGVIVAYQDHYYSAVSDPYARALSVTRLDLTGAKVYEPHLRGGGRGRRRRRQRPCSLAGGLRRQQRRRGLRHGSGSVRRRHGGRRRRDTDAARRTGAPPESLQSPDVPSLHAARPRARTPDPPRSARPTGADARGRGPGGGPARRDLAWTGPGGGAGGKRRVRGAAGVRREGADA